MARRLARMHPVIAFEGVAEGQLQRRVIIT
jgi:hypothetical protein